MKTGTRPDIAVTTPNAKLRLSAQDVLADYGLAVRSRAASELSRREVLVGNAPFGISGEGKEVAQLGMARAFRAGDWRSGYYRDSPAPRTVSRGFSHNGEEVCFATIGNAGTSEGVFWESLNAAGVLQIPLLISVWDDGCGMSVPNEFQTTKGSISAVLEGFRRGQGGNGLDLYTVKGHDYVACCDVYQIAVERARRDHIPALVHVTEMTQPQGHSTSGSHERYTSKDRIRCEIEFDPIRRMREWIIREEIADAATLDALERESRVDVERIREAAWDAYVAPIHADREHALAIIEAAVAESGVDLDPIAAELRSTEPPTRRLVASTARRALVALRGSDGSRELATFVESYRKQNDELFNSYLYSRSEESPLRIGAVPPAYAADAETADGRMVLLRCFDANLSRDPRIVILGEDVGKLGDVNLVFEGLQAKHGEQRVIDTGIREATILGQGIGVALRGLRPIVDIQYVDYLLYALELAADDLATLHWRTGGGQKAPVLIRTKGHRLQGIWHTGSPMATIVSSLRGLHVAVPRDMTRAAGLYNTLLRGDDPGLLIEVLSGYRLKERIPENVGEFTIPLGVPETLRSGADVTLVTYGALCRIAVEAAEDLAELGIDTEIVDVQTLLPFDIDHAIAESVAKTRALLVVDEDVPGGASAYILREVTEVQGGIDHLDVGPRTLTATANRVAVGNDGDYFSKPNREDIVGAVYAIMRERRPDDFPPIAPERLGP